MAYPLDVAAQNAGLKAWFGSSHGSTAPSSFKLALFTTHPLLGGTELTATGGYARQTLVNNSTNFPDPVAGVLTMAPITWPDPSGAWSDTVQAFVLIDAADGTTRWFAGLLLQEIDVLAAGPGFVITPVIRWNTEGL